MNQKEPPGWGTAALNLLRPTHLPCSRTPSWTLVRPTARGPRSVPTMVPKKQPLEAPCRLPPLGLTSLSSS